VARVTALLERPEVIPGVRLRTATPADHGEVRAFLRGLTLDSAYRRFFTGLGSVPESLVRRLLDDRPGRAVLLAVTAGGVVGLADTTVLDRTTVELGVVVADAWQRQGLGWPLADAALAPALRAGATILRAHTLPDNARVARMLRRRWPSAHPRFDDGTLVWEMDLTGPVARER
jgi:GNAT superfamily N-acetyltransferase